MPKRRPLEERLWEKVDKSGPIPAVRPDLGRCWLWIGAKLPSGYGRIGSGIGKQVVQAHRVAYEFSVGPIPDGLELDHLCRNPPCVNPRHLDPVTQYENNRRGYSPCAQNLRKTHCPQGHPYDEANTYRDPAGGRACLTCKPGRGNGKFRRTTHCKYGHALTPDNVYTTPEGYWHCRICRRAADARRTAKAKPRPETL